MELTKTYQDGKWLNKWKHIHVIEYYLLLRRNELSILERQEIKTT